MLAATVHFLIHDFGALTMSTLHRLIRPLAMRRYRLAAEGKLPPEQRTAALHDAAIARHPEACRHLGAAYLTGRIGGRISHAMAHDWLKKATDCEDVASWYWRACLALSVEDARMAREAASSDDRSGHEATGFLKEDDTGIPSGREAALEFCRKGRQAGDRPASLLLLRILSMGPGAGTDEGLQALQDAAAFGAPWALTELAEACMAGDIRAVAPGQDAASSVGYWLTKALVPATGAQGGNAPNAGAARAHLLMCRAMEQGLVPRSVEGLRRHLKAAADAGLPEAWFRYGVFLLRADRDGLNAEAYLRRAAEAGYSDAAATLGDWLTLACPDAPAHLGYGWYLRAISMGHVGAMLHMSGLVLSGRTSGYTDAQLAAWLREAAARAANDDQRTQVRLLTQAYESMKRQAS